MSIEEFKQQLEKACTDFKRELSGVRANRPHAGLVEEIKVNYYGEQVPLKSISSVSVVPPREINIQAWDKGAVSNIVKAIEGSDLGLGANSEGTTIRIFLPELSAERREELVKYVKRMSEEHRIKIRHARDEVNKNIEKITHEGEISEDEKFKLKKEVQELTDKANQEIEKLMEAKTEEINKQ